MLFAYADPPYIGQAKKHYSHDPNCAEVDHQALIKRLEQDYPDGWALSCSSTSLQEILSYAPKEVRIGAWVKPFAIFKPNVNPGYTWEPVIWKGGRKLTRQDPTCRDWSDESVEDAVKANITLKKGLCGAKPEPFCLWLIRLFGTSTEDIWVDLYPGTRAFSSTWASWREGPQKPLERKVTGQDSWENPPNEGAGRGGET